MCIHKLLRLLILLLIIHFNDELHVVIPRNIDAPDTFNDELHVVIPFNIAVPDTLNDLKLVKIT